MYLHDNLRLTPIAVPTAEAYLFSHRKSGLKFTTATDGTSEWVRPEDVERFKTDGATLLGKEAEVRDEETEARKTALSQFESMHQKPEVVPQVLATNDRHHQQITSQLNKIQDDLSELLKRVPTA